MVYRAKINGIEVQHKKRVAFEIIKQYIEMNKKHLNAEQLKQEFNNKSFSNEAIIMDEKDKQLFLERRGDAEFKIRYFTKPKEVLKLNNENIYVTTQWGDTGDEPNRYFGGFLKYVTNNLKLKIEVISKKATTINEEDNHGENEKIIQSMLKIKNIILYGAPGVGKTHNYQRIISMIEDGVPEKETFNTITKNTKTDLGDDTFQTIKNEKRVEFVTFHQSYSYEDFIEGYRPSEDEDKIVRKNGIFKIISDKAKKNLENSNKELKTISEEKKFEEIFELFKDFIQDEIDKNKKFSINETAYISNIEEDAFRYAGDNWGNTQRMKFSDIELLYSLNIVERKEIKKIDNISGLAKQHATYFSYFMKKLVNFKKQQNITIENIQKIDLKIFYIVIDEINRGNISKIFGELITLIEEDKRDKYEVTLPYSKEPFKVPSNLYIIATMNSTDKSIATIDIALRRRFTFLKMKPNLELIDNDEARVLMQELNIFINDNIGEDYMLGHSYFMGNNIDLEFIKEYKIKPLLEEYFYSDDEKLKEVLEKLNVDIVK